MKFPFPFKPTETTTTSSAALSWPWPTCVSNPKTLSFRAGSTADDIYRTMNSAYLDDKTPDFAADSFFSVCSSFREESFSFLSENDETAVIRRGLRSDRLLFEPGATSNSILEEAKPQLDHHHSSSYKENVAILAIESRDPFHDFRVSMEEMVEAHGLKDWECLEELLQWYLRVNGRSNHGYIVGAFVDLLVHISLASAPADSDESPSSAIDENCSSSSTTTQYSFTSPLSFSSSTRSSTSPCLSSLENEDEIVVTERNGECSCSSLSASPSPGV
ncbi:Transcription repressor OFP13 [Sesamum alatum]|uniref:Transcription repressor n=1 Tax=Sesamum alatum TaxID=300844 RepID=A0AAE1XIM7_9LAMI|nr:Transcription repressor OFP13 [Sesamum alatum]